MMVPTKSDWLAAEVLADQTESFILWAIKKGLCSSRDDFRKHFASSLPINDIIDSLQERGFVREDESSLALTDLGKLVVRSLLKDNPASDVAESLDAKLAASVSSTDKTRKSAEEANLPSYHEEIARCTAALEGRVDLDADEYADDQLREYLLWRLNLLLLLRDGYTDLLGELLSRLCPSQYQRSLALMVIRGAQRGGFSQAFEMAKAILKQYIDPEVLGLAADIANNLGRVRELEEVVRASRHLEHFRKELKSFAGGWTHAYLERIGLGNLSRLLKE